MDGGGGTLGRVPSSSLLQAPLSGPESERSGRHSVRDVIARRPASLEGAVTSPRGELRRDAAATPGGVTGLPSAHRRPGEAGNWG